MGIPIVFGYLFVPYTTNVFHYFGNLLFKNIYFKNHFIREKKKFVVIRVRKQYFNFQNSISFCEMMSRKANKK